MAFYSYISAMKLKLNCTCAKDVLLHEIILAIVHLIFNFSSAAHMHTWFIKLDSHIDPIVNELAVNLAHIFDDPCERLRLQIKLRLLHLYQHPHASVKLSGQGHFPWVPLVAIDRHPSRLCERQTSFRLQAGSICLAEFAAALWV